MRTVFPLKLQDGPHRPLRPERDLAAMRCLRDTKGLTLIELVVAVGVVAILAAIAMPLYQSFLKKAKAVEAESVLRDIERLETTYYIENGTYSNNLSVIGFSRSSQLEYFTQVRITVGSGRRTPGARGKTPLQYQVIVKGNLDGDPDEDAWILTKYNDDTSDILHGCIPGGRGWRISYNCKD